MRRRGASSSISRRADAGFTLLELLLAVSLLSLITAAIMGGLHLGRKSFEAGRVHQAAGDLEAQATALSNIFAHAYPVADVDAIKSDQVTFSGRPDGCSFVSLSEGTVQTGGLTATEIELSPTEQGGEVDVWTTTYRGKAIASITRDMMQKTEAARNVAYFNLSYFGEIDKGKPLRWSDSWPTGSRMPLLVSVRFGAYRYGSLVDASFYVAIRQKRQ